MTTQNNAAQAELQDINAIIAKHFGDDTAGAVRAQITVNEVLSKLRAPVAEPETMEETHRRERERAPFVLPKDPTLPDSAPVADEEVQPVAPDDESIAEAWVTASDSDGIAYDGHSFERGYQLGEIAERDRRASAPVAGEARPMAWRYWNEKSSSWNTTTSSVVADAMREAGRAVEPLYAAPQASAYGHTQQPMDTSPGHSAPQAPAGWRWTLHPAGLHPDVYAAAAAHTSDEARNAALEEAAVIVETAPDYLQDSSFKGAARAIRALKTTPAPTAADHVNTTGSDVDIDRQQRAGDAGRWRWATAIDENAQTLHSIVLCHGGDQQKINERADFYRAALAARKEDGNG